MRTFITLIDRNRKLFFKDKGMLLSSLITPIILIVLYATFLQKCIRILLPAIFQQYWTFQKS